MVLFDYILSYVVFSGTKMSPVMVQHETSWASARPVGKQDFQRTSAPPEGFSSGQIAHCVKEERRKVCHCQGCWFKTKDQIKRCKSVYQKNWTIFCSFQTHSFHAELRENSWLMTTRELIFRGTLDSKVDPYLLLALNQQPQEVKVSALAPWAISWLLKNIHWHISTSFLSHWTSKWTSVHPGTWTSNLGIPNGESPGEFI